MDEIVLVLITAGATVVVAIIGVYTARLAQRGNREQTAMTTAADERHAVLEGYDKLNEDLSRQNVQMQKVIDTLRARVEVVEARIFELDDARMADRRALISSAGYVATLIGVLTAHGIPIPAAPN